ncbi:MAG: alpha/beta fold hydrolase [Planctomycetota bacterium]
MATQTLRPAAALVFGFAMLSLVGAQLAIAAEVPIRASDGTTHRPERGWVDVPENRSHPSSTTIRVAYVRFAHPNPSQPPVFYLAGGPGGSGIHAAERFIQNGGDRFFELIGGDLIGIDQRGAGASEPNLESSLQFQLSTTEAGNELSMLETMRATVGEERLRLKRLGIDVSAYNTHENAADIDAIRRRLGYPRISLWGASYGSHLAFCLLRRFPGTIERALITGPEGPNHTWKLPSDTQRILEQLSKRAAQDSVWRKHMPDMLGTLATVLEELEQQPREVMLDGKLIRISRFDLQRVLGRDIGTVAGGSDSFPERLWRCSNGDWESLARELHEDRRAMGIGSAMTCAMDLASGATAARNARIDTEIAETLLGDTANFPLRNLRDAWHVADLGDSFREPLSTEVPVQFIVGELDARTPISNAVELQRTLEKSGLLIVENVGHNDVPLGQSELRDAWSHFFRTGEVTSGRIRTAPIQFTVPAELSIPLHKDAIRIERSELANLVGEYRFPEGRVISIDAAENHLLLHMPGKRRVRLWPLGTHEFFSELKEVPRIHFLMGASGAVDRLSGKGRVARRLSSQISNYIQPSTETLQRLEGWYDYGELGRMKLTRVGSRLEGRLPGQDPMRLRALNDAEFECLEVDLRIVVREDDSGAVAGLEHHQHGQMIVVRRQP